MRAAERLKNRPASRSVTEAPVLAVRGWKNLDGGEREREKWGGRIFYFFEISAIRLLRRA